MPASEDEGCGASHTAASVDDRLRNEKGPATFASGADTRVKAGGQKTARAPDFA
jgi:hypothetical protein